MDREDLLAELSQDILAYVMHGTFPEQHVAREIKPTGLDERFDDYEMLIRLHFILRPEVVDFVEALPKRLRSIKTETKDISRVTRGGGGGRINWNATVRKRYATNPRDRSLFVCENRSEDYDIDENVVLKRLLAIIYNTLVESEEYLRRDYDWVTERWKSSGDLIQSMKQVFERNVHITRIRPPEEYEPTERMLQRATSARSEIYRESAELLRMFRRSLAGDETAIRELLDETAITPDDDETLFELFVLFKYITAIEQLQEDQFQMRTIGSASQEVGRIETGDQQVVLYHDSSASDRSLSFVTEAKEKPDHELTRTERILRESRRVANQYFLDDEFSRRTGRPDVIVLEVQSDDGYEYLITEVKHSTRPETIRAGIKETLEYLAFLRQDDTYVHGDDEIFGSGWNGILVTQDIEDRETAALDEQRSIRILQASEVEDKLEAVVDRILS